MAAGVRLNSIKADLKKEREGEWIDIPDLPGVRLKVRGLNYGPYQAELGQASAKSVRRYFSKGQPIPPDVNFATNARLFHHHILVDWEGFVDEDGDPIPIEEAASILYDPAYRALHNHIQYAASLVGESEVEFVEDAVKNLPPSSDGNSREAAE